MQEPSKKILAQTKALYRKRGGITFFVYVRYWEYPRYLRIEKLLPKQGFIVDLGCGYGIFTNFLGLTGPDRKILGIEMNPAKARHAENGIANVTFASQDIRGLDIPSADVVILMHVLHHLHSYPAQQELVAHCVDRLKPGGILLIDEVDRRPFWRLWLTRLADFLLYPGEPVYFRYRADMLKLIERFPLTVEVSNVDGPLMPFAQTLYLCRKKAASG
ncbi:MAG: class I SAM-dependent methyltransferase [Kiritimatiellae bacterium]|nr:class I SAM-dependent methyltransferase [Kiritimatiellia bacterium]